MPIAWMEPLLNEELTPGHAPTSTSVTLLMPFLKGTDAVVSERSSCCVSRADSEVLASPSSEHGQRKMSTSATGSSLSAFPRESTRSDLLVKPLDGPPAQGPTRAQHVKGVHVTAIHVDLGPHASPPEILGAPQSFGVKRLAVAHEGTGGRQARKIALPGGRRIGRDPWVFGVFAQVQAPSQMIAPRAPHMSVVACRAGRIEVRKHGVQGRLKRHAHVAAVPGSHAHGCGLAAPGALSPHKYLAAVHAQLPCMVAQKQQRPIAVVKGSWMGSLPRQPVSGRDDHGTVVSRDIHGARPNDHLLHPQSIYAILADGAPRCLAPWAIVRKTQSSHRRMRKRTNVRRRADAG